MKITVLRNELVSALSTVMGVIERSQTLQILSHVLIDASGDVVALTGTNLEIELRTVASATIDAPGKATVHARKLFDITKNLPEGAEVQLAFESEKATLKCGRSRYTLPVLPAIDVPLMDCRPLDHGASFCVAERDLKRLIQRVAFAVGVEDVRPYLNGMLLHLVGNEIRAVGSDGVSLGRANIRHENTAAEPVEVLLHARTIKEIVRLLSDGEERATIRVARQMAELQLSACRVTTKALDYAYVPYERVMDFETKWAMKVDRDALRAALIRSAFVVNTTNKALRLTLRPDAMEIAASASATEAGTEHLDIEFDGTDGFEIGFAVDALTDAVTALPPGPIVMRINSDDRPARLLSASNDDCQYLVMPYRL